MGRPRAGEAGDDDGRGDLDVVDLGMAPQEVLDQEAVLDELDQLGVPRDDAGWAQTGLGPQGAAEDLEPVDEGPVAGVVEAGRLPRRGADGLGVDGAGGRHLGHGRPELIDLGRETGGGEIVEDDGCRSAHEKTGSTGVVTRAVGRAGVASGRNQRNQMRPRSCPAVEIQFGWPGSRGATTRRQEPSGS